jgi:DNA transposition AAA+ family ATPase
MSKLKESFDELNRLGDEIGLKLHLAGMDAKDAFADIKKRAAELARNVETASEEAVNDLVTRMRKIAAAIKTSDQPPSR